MSMPTQSPTLYQQIVGVKYFTGENPQSEICPLDHLSVMKATSHHPYPCNNLNTSAVFALGLAASLLLSFPAYAWDESEDGDPHVCCDVCEAVLSESSQVHASDWARGAVPMHRRVMCMTRRCMPLMSTRFTVGLLACQRRGMSHPMCVTEPDVLSTLRTSKLSPPCQQSDAHAGKARDARH